MLVTKPCKNTTDTVRVSTARFKLLEAREELARLELERVQAEAALVRARLELLQLGEDITNEEKEKPEERSSYVQEWGESTLHRGAVVTLPQEQSTTTEPRGQQLQVYSSGIQELANAIREAVSASSEYSGAAPPDMNLYKLPIFNGNSYKWLAFKTVYYDTESLFTPVQNIIRLKRALRGKAREAFKDLLYSNDQPSVVMDCLRRCFDRPDYVMSKEIEKLKKLKLTDKAGDVCVFANHVNNTVLIIKALKKPQYLKSWDVINKIVEKMPAVLRYRWYDFAADYSREQHDLALMASYLKQEADKCSAFALYEEISETT